MAERWDPRNIEHRRFFLTDVLGPLIVATRPSDLRTADAVEDAARAWMLALAEIPAAVLEAGVARVLATGNGWMPRPGDVRVACAAVVAERHRAVGPAAQALIAECVQCGGSTWEDYRGDDGARRVTRCGCHARSLALLAGLPQPITLPPAHESDEATS